LANYGPATLRQNQSLIFAENKKTKKIARSATNYIGKFQNKKQEQSEVAATCKAHPKNYKYYIANRFRI
jgi:hypothetical protein